MATTAPSPRQVSAGTPPDLYDVAVGKLSYRPWHAWGDDTTWIDGRLVDGSGTAVRDLDIGSTADTDCVDDTQRTEAEAAWASGRVFAYRPYPRSPLVLLVPGPLTRNHVEQALRRFRA